MGQKSAVNFEKLVLKKIAAVEFLVALQLPVSSSLSQSGLFEKLKLILNYL